MVEQEISWKHVLDGSKFMPGTNLTKAVELTHKLGYKFFSWNGMVYFVDEEGTKHNTNIYIQYRRL